MLLMKINSLTMTISSMLYTLGGINLAVISGTERFFNLTGLLEVQSMKSSS